MPRVPGSNVPDRPIGPTPEVVKRREELTSYPTRHNIVPFHPGVRLKGAVELVILDDQREVFESTAVEILSACREFNTFFAETPEDELWVFPTWCQTVKAYNDRLARPIQAALLDVKLGESRTGLDLLIDTRAMNPNAFLVIHSSYAAGLAESENYKAADIGLPKDIDPALRALFVLQVLQFPQIMTCGLCPLYELKEEQYFHNDLGLCHLEEVVGRGQVHPMDDKKVLFHHATICVWVLAALLQHKLADPAWRERNGHHGAADYLKAVADKLSQKSLLTALPAKILARVKALRAELPDVRLSNGAGRMLVVKNRMPIVAGKQQRNRKVASDFLPLDPLNLDAAGFPRLRPLKDVHPPHILMRPLTDAETLLLMKPVLTEEEQARKRELLAEVYLDEFARRLGAKYRRVF